MARSRKPKQSARGGLRPGAGRKPKHANAVLIAARIPQLLCQQLDEFARHNGLNRSAALLEAIRRLTET